jgi:hypothetical protein
MAILGNVESADSRMGVSRSSLPSRLFLLLRVLLSSGSSAVEIAGTKRALVALAPTAVVDIEEKAGH